MRSHRRSLYQSWQQIINPITTTKHPLMTLYLSSYLSTHPSWQWLIWPWPALYHKYNGHDHSKIQFVPKSSWKSKHGQKEIIDLLWELWELSWNTVYPKKYAHGFCFAVLCCGYTLTDFPISIRLTSLALWQSNDCPSASKATLMNMDKYFMWIHYERLHNHNKAKHNKTVCIFLGIYCNVHISPNDKMY